MDTLAAGTTALPKNSPEGDRTSSGIPRPAGGGVRHRPKRVFSFRRSGRPASSEKGCSASTETGVQLRPKSARARVTTTWTLRGRTPAAAPPEQTPGDLQRHRGGSRRPARCVVCPRQCQRADHRSLPLALSPGLPAPAARHLGSRHCPYGAGRPGLSRGASPGLCCGQAAGLCVRAQSRGTGQRNNQTAHGPRRAGARSPN